MARTHEYMVQTGKRCDIMGVKGGDTLSKALTPAKRKAIKKYDQNNTKRISLKLNLKTDADILEKLKSAGNVQGYIKALIREDMAEQMARGLRNA